MPDDEFARIARIAAILGERPAGADDARDPVIVISIGDDCATLDPARLRRGESLAWTIDASVEEVHFRRGLLPMEDVGYRATVAAASDLLAMGARPIAALAAWTLPRDAGDDEVEAIARGQRDAARALGLELIGGNLSAGPVLSITTTALGATKRPIARRGARAGDRLVVAGALGEAALGLAWLMRGRYDLLDDDAARVATAWRRPTVLLAACRAVAGVATAMIDVSDGLAQDVGHLARASSVRATIDCARLHDRRSPHARSIARALDADLDDLELAGGEDYALVATIPPDASIPEGFDVIGAIDEGEGVRVLGCDGAPREAPAGFRHGGVGDSRQTRRFRGWGT